MPGTAALVRMAALATVLGLFSSRVAAFGDRGPQLGASGRGSTVARMVATTLAGSA